MDSLHFHRTVFPLLRDECDARLEKVLAWVGAYATPEQIFTDDQLANWAHTHGYTRTQDVRQIAALLQRVSGRIERDSPLSVEVANAIAEYTPHVG